MTSSLPVARSVLYEVKNTQRIEDQDPFFVHTTSDDAGNVMLVWQNPLGVWASRFD